MRVWEAPVMGPAEAYLDSYIGYGNSEMEESGPERVRWKDEAKLGRGFTEGHRASDRLRRESCQCTRIGGDSGL